MPFVEAHPTREDYWRSVILFGRSVATYKFALAMSLLELAPSEPNFGNHAFESIVGTTA
jgi:hypothetical protein